MKPTLAFLFFTMLALASVAQNPNPAYDSALAAKLGGDENGMKRYMLVILKTGSNQNTDQAFLDSCFAGHFANMDRLVKEGKLIVAGPISKNEKTYRGIFILNVSTMEEAQAIVQTDPAIHAKILDTEIYTWYGSAALPVYLDYVDRIVK